jgi:hypothetical protein
MAGTPFRYLPTAAFMTAFCKRLKFYGISLLVYKVIWRAKGILIVEVLHAVYYTHFIFVHNSLRFLGGETLACR